MSDHDHDFPKTTVSQFVLALLGGLFAPGLVIFLIIKLSSRQVARDCCDLKHSRQP